MKKILTLFLIALSSIPLSLGQSISGIINTYAKVDSIDFCTNTIHVVTTAGFSIGDRILILQMKGADINLTNTASFGNINAYNNAGNYEFGNIATITGTAIKLVNAIERTYDAAGVIQLIRVPQYTNATVDATLTATDWNGTVGGVVVFETNTLTLNADIDVSGKGFRGGDAGNFPSSCPTGLGTSLYYSDTLSGKGGEKGEGIVVLSNGYLACRGKEVNGGGGGNDHNAGAGGGANGSAGGIGGNNDEPTFSCPGSPGLASIALDQTMASDKIFFGGGGGAGHGNNTNGTSGGDGGGIIIIKANSIDGNNHSLLLNGESVTDQAWGDGAGGGGAGGSALITSSTIIELNIIAKGGKGGDTGADQCTGPGGGGSGGVIKHSGVALWPGVTTDLTGGTFGTNTTTTSPCFGDNNGASAGAIGIIISGLNYAESAIPFNPDFANAGSDINVCPGNSVSLNATGGVSYVWSPATYLDNAFIANPICTPTSSITYTVTVTNANGCTDADNISVNVYPAVDADAGSDISVCTGGSATLNATGGVNYVWSPATFLDNAFISNPVCTPLTNMNYTVTVTDANGCVGSDDIFVTVNDGDFISATPMASTCIGGSVTLSATGADTYLWSPATYLDDATSPNPVCTPAADIIYMVIGYNASGCTDTAYVMVHANAADFLILSDDVAVCAGGSVTLNASGGTEYVWSPVMYLDDATSPNPVCTPLTDITYYVTATNASGCNDVDTINVTITPSDFLTVAPAVDLCAGSYETLNASGAVSYEWIPSTYLDDAFSSSPVCTPDADITYTVVGTNAEGCNDYETVTVHVFPAVVATAGPDTTVCFGGQIKLHAEGGVEYNWEPPTYLDFPTISGPTSNPLSSITYIVYVTDANGCVGTDTVDIVVNTPPVIDAGDDVTICRGDTVTLSATGADHYVWLPDPLAPCGDCASADFAPTTTTTYSVQGYDLNGCVGSDEVMVTVTICNGIENILANQIKVYPNPANDFISIDVPEALKTATILIMNLLGERIPVETEQTANGFLMHLENIPDQELLIHLIYEGDVVVKMVTVINGN